MQHTKIEWENSCKILRKYIWLCAGLYSKRSAQDTAELYEVMNVQLKGDWCISNASLSSLWPNDILWTVLCSYQESQQLWKVHKFPNGFARIQGQESISARVAKTVSSHTHSYTPTHTHAHTYREPHTHRLTHTRRANANAVIVGAASTVVASFQMQFESSRAAAEATTTNSM